MMLDFGSDEPMFRFFFLSISLFFCALRHSNLFLGVGAHL